MATSYANKRAFGLEILVRWWTNLTFPFVEMESLSTHGGTGLFFAYKNETRDWGKELSPTTTGRQISRSTNKPNHCPLGAGEIFLKIIRIPSRNGAIDAFPGTEREGSWVAFLFFLLAVGEKNMEIRNDLSFCIVLCGYYPSWALSAVPMAMRVVCVYVCRYCADSLADPWATSTSQSGAHGARYWILKENINHLPQTDARQCVHECVRRL